MNLVDLVQGQLGSNVLTRLAETLGTSPDNTRTAVNAAIPTLLTAFGSVASTRDGARDLAAAWAVSTIGCSIISSVPERWQRVWSQSGRSWDEAHGLAPGG